MSEAPHGDGQFNQQVARAVARVADAEPSLAGMGILLIEDGRYRTLRTPSCPSGSYLLVRVRPASEAMGGPGGRAATGQGAAAPGGMQPVTQELIGLGFNCGGAVLAWVGVAGTAASAPVTGGTSLAGTALLWGGALATTGQCAASIYRTRNELADRHAANAELDRNPTYVWTMRGADLIGLIGVGGAIREVRMAHQALGRAGTGWGRARGSAGMLNRTERLRLTTELGLVGARRLPAAQINQVIRQRMLDALNAAVGMGSSATGGILREIGVWILTPETARP